MTKSQSEDTTNKFNADTVNQLIGVKEAYQAPDALMKILWDKSKREKLFKKFLRISTDVSDDWFRQYFQDVQADRTKKKQDFTPASISKLMTKLTHGGHEYYEPAVGTGGILIQRWYSDCLKHTPLVYQPAMYFYHVEELGDSALPFLLFNILIRGMNATVVHGDSLERTVNQVYFCQNDNNDFLQFSSLNVMPHSKVVANEFQTKEWLAEPIKHIESTDYPGYLKATINAMKANE